MFNKEFSTGMKAAVPVVLGYVPIGLAFGVLAAQGGLSPWDVFFMSLLVYAGSSQFIAVGLIAAGASWGTIVFTTFLVNSRHILMSASLVPYLKKFTSPILSVIGFGITDETFAVAMGDLVKESKGPSYFLGLNLTSQLAWIVSTVSGAVVGNVIPNPEAFGFNFALPAMFIGLLVMQMRERISSVIAVIAIILSLYFKYLIPGNWNVILATVITATIGVIIEEWILKSSQSSSV
ncbi:MAG: AzlC family ABC transporter permease [Bacillota bacterium]